MAMFLRWTLTNCVFCLDKFVELPFIRAIRIVCFVTNFAMLLGLFTLDNDCTTFESNSFCTTTSFANLVKFGMTSFTMGSSITFSITSTFVRMLGYATMVFSIYRSISFATFLTFQFPHNNITCFFPNMFCNSLIFFFSSFIFLLMLCRLCPLFDVSSYHL